MVGAKSFLSLVGYSVSIRSCHGWTAAPISLTSSSSTNPVKVVHRDFRLQSSSDASTVISTSPLDAMTPPLSDFKSTTIPYNWKNQWYAVTFASYVTNPSSSAEVTPISVFGNPMVLWRSQDDGDIHCADDECPHRAAALSEGRLRDGKLECVYETSLLLFNL